MWDLAKAVGVVLIAFFLWNLLGGPRRVAWVKDKWDDWMLEGGETEAPLPDPDLPVLSSEVVASLDIPASARQNKILGLPQSGLMPVG